MKQVPSLSVVSQQFAVNRPNADEGLWAPLYDYQTYPAAGAASFTFFQTPIGQSSKTISDTNMTQAGLLPAPQKFLVTGIEVVILPSGNPGNTGAVGATVDGSFVNDVYKIMSTLAVLRLKIGAKDYVVDGPLMTFPPCFRLAGFAALGGVGAAAGNIDQINYASSVGRPYEPAPFFIPPVQNFAVTVEFKNGTLVPTISTATAVIGVRLLGFLYRLSQ